MSSINPPNPFKIAVKKYKELLSEEIYRITNTDSSEDIQKELKKYGITIDSEDFEINMSTSGIMIMISGEGEFQINIDFLALLVQISSLCDSSSKK